MANLPKRIALVYDSVNKWGGAEVVLLALHDLFPQAPLYTAMYDQSKATWAQVFPDVIPSFLQKLPLAKSHREFFPWLTPLAFESFNFSQYEAVISVTSADAKGIITPPHTFHLCYCLTPTRYLWSHHLEYKSQLGQTLGYLSNPVFNYLKRWDISASQRPDAYISISRTVGSRIKDFYHLDSPVIYPPVDIEDNLPKSDSKFSLKDYFLYIGRLVFYKHPETIIDVFNQLNLPLVVIGTGNQEKKLKKLAKSNISFTGFVSHQEKIAYINNCTALIFFHEEDFGIVPIEAQAAGKPVIALNRGGASETIIHNQTGILLNDASPDSLSSAILSFDQTMFNPELIKKHSQKYSKTRFQSEFVKIFSHLWKKYKNTYSY
jgi:glycosyltransferase involved in cell wall biosynthesis